MTDLNPSVSNQGVKVRVRIGDPRLTIQPIIPAKSRTSLPPEIITQIVLFLDGRTACTFARCCRLFAGLATRSIWRDIDLTVNPNYGGYPLVQPYPKLEDNGARDMDHDDWAYFEALAVEGRHDAGVKAKVDGLLRRSGQQGWRWIRTLRLLLVTSAVPAMAEVLVKVGPSLEQLEMVMPKLPFTRIPIDLRADESLDHHILSRDIRLSFPSLTVVRIVEGCLWFLEWVVLLSASAPELLDLDVNLDGLWKYPASQATNATLPTHTTKMQRLRLVFFDAGADLIAAVRSLITHSPALRLLSFSYRMFDRTNAATRSMMEGLRSRLRLQDVHWHEGPLELGTELDEAYRRTGEAGYPSLKRLVLGRCRAFDVVSVQLQFP
jgi:hypothetical protein